MEECLNNYFKNCAIFDKLSDVTRIVDPLSKKVIEYRSDGVDPAVLSEILNFVHCYEFFSRDKVCDNCVSMRAYNDDETYIKIEYSKDKIYMITAVPFKKGDRRLVIEIIKNITNSVIFDSGMGLGNGLTNIHSLIDNMNRLVFSDELTGVYNRRYIMEKLPVDLLNNTLLSMEMSVIMADIDNFKAINDTFGHLAGDMILKSVAEVLSGCVKRSNDWVARYGGEEFLICMPGADIETAKSTAECMRRTIESRVFSFDGKDSYVTVSFGIHNIKHTDSVSVDDILKLADDKLYLAKKHGKNKIEY